MKLVPYLKLSPELQLEARTLHPHLGPDFTRWTMPVRNDGHISRARGTHGMTRAYEKQILREIAGEDIRTKGDLSEWCPGVTFHFSRD